MVEDTAKTRLRIPQIVAHHVDRFGARLGDLLRRHSTEEAHLNQNHQVRIFFGELRQCRVQVKKIFERLGGGKVFGELNAQPASSLLRAPGAGVIHQDLAHHSRRDSQEMRAIGKYRRGTREQPQKCLIQYRGGL